MKILALGCSSGSGLHFAQTAIEDEHEIISVSRTKPDCDVLRHYECDLMNAESVRETIMFLKGGYDGAVFYQRGRNREDDQWDNEIQVGLNATREFIRNITWNGGSSIVVIGSLAGSHAVFEQDDGYHVAKAGMLALVKFYALKYGKKGVQVNMVSPGEVATQGWIKDNPKLDDFCSTIIPLGETGDSTDITEVVMFLLEGGGYITGQEIVVDGGLSVIGQGSLMHKFGREQWMK